MGIKFFKSGNQFVLGDSVKDYKPSGIYEADVHTLNGLEYLAIYQTGTNYKLYDHLFSSYDDINGVPYVSMDALLLATAGFFTGGSSTITDSSGNVLLPTGTPVKLTAELTRTNADVTAYAAGDSVNASASTPAMISFDNTATITNGGGGIALLLKVESNMTSLASGVLRLWFYNAALASIPADHVAFTNTYANAAKRCFYVDVTIDPLLAGSDTVLGQVDITKEYLAAVADNHLYCLIQTLTAFTPTAGGKITVELSALKLS